MQAGLQRGPHSGGLFLWRVGNHAGGIEPLLPPRPWQRRRRTAIILSRDVNDWGRAQTAISVAPNGAERALSRVGAVTTTAAITAPPLELPSRGLWWTGPESNRRPGSVRLRLFSPSNPLRPSYPLSVRPLTARLFLHHLLTPVPMVYPQAEAHSKLGGNLCVVAPLLGLPLTEFDRDVRHVDCGL